jgi:acyl-CoA carboxylase epsilon subunit-like protein
MTAPAFTIAGGGRPTAPQLAALTAALDALIESERAVLDDPLPAAYRSRWRRAALMETTEVPVNVKDLGPPWGGW